MNDFMFSRLLISPTMASVHLLPGTNEPPFSELMSGSTAATLPKSNAKLHVWHLYAVGGAMPAMMALLVRAYVSLFGSHLPRERLHKVHG